MSSPVSTVDDAPATPASAKAGKEATAEQDGWRTGGLPALRTELDRIDNAIHDLLMQRAEIVEYVARSGKPAAFRPGREASILRRLVGRHHGALPPVALVRIWRELLAGTTSMQGRFSLAVGDVENGAPLAQLAREHFGALTPLRADISPDQALADVGRGVASVAVLPYPSETCTWWVSLPHRKPRLHIIGCLPFWAPRPEGFPSVRALVVAATAPDASGEDRSFLGLECDSDTSPADLSDKLLAVGLEASAILLVRRHGSATANVLVETSGYLSDDDSRLRHLGPILRQPSVLGSYAIPIGGAS